MFKYFWKHCSNSPLYAIKVLNLNLVDNNIKALSRAMAQVDALNINNTEIIPINSQEKSCLSKIKNKLNNITIHLFVNDKITVDSLDIDFDIFDNSYFICLSNENEEVIDEIYENISSFKDIQNVSIRSSKIGRFNRYEKIFKINNYEQNIPEIDIDEDEIPF